MALAFWLISLGCYDYAKERSLTMTTLLQPNLFDHVDGPPGALVVRRVNHETARIPCEQWHYLGTMPGASTDMFGIWENEQFKGVIIFGAPTARRAHESLGLRASGDVLELLRIAMCGHDAPITAAISQAVRLLKHGKPELQLLLSYADPKAGHKGYVYQAGSWVYLGQDSTSVLWNINGKIVHPRTVVATYGTQAIRYIQTNVDAQAHRVYSEAKHKYAFALNRRVRKQLAAMALPYPKG